MHKIMSKLSNLYYCELKNKAFISKIKEEILMLKSNTGSSVNPYALAAGSEAAAKAKASLSEVKLAFAYASVAYNLKEMLDGIKEELPGVPVIGNTSFTGVITPEGFITGDEGFLGILALSGADLAVSVAASERTGEGPRAIGARLAKEAMTVAGKNSPPDYFYMVASPAEEEHYLKGITEVIGRVPFFGGSAADNSIAGEWWIYTDKELFQDGCAIAFFYTDGEMKNEYTGAYHETEHFGIVTKMIGDRQIAEIDGVPALKKYAEWRGMDADYLKGGVVLGESICFPLGVKDRLGDLVAIRHPMGGNDDYSINVGNKVSEKTAVIMMHATVDELISSTGDTLAGLRGIMDSKPAAYHLVHCGGRRAGIGDRIDEVAKQLIKEADGVPFIAEFTFGEYGHKDDGLNTCGGLMLSFTAIGN